MNEGKTRGIALSGTIALHVLVVWWLASSPEATARILRAVEMDFIEVEPEPEPEPEPEIEIEIESEPEPEPEPQPEPRPRRRRASLDRNESNQNSSNEPPSPQPAEERTEGPPDQPPGPRVIDFGEQNFAQTGTGAGWSMASSSGGSRFGFYRPGALGGGGGGGGPSAGGELGLGEPRDFSPVPMSQLSRRAQLIGRLNRDYPQDARSQMIEGTVRLMVEIRANGRVRSARLLSEPGGGLGMAAIQSIRQARFRPALDRQGQPVDTRIVYTVRFILDD